MSGRSGMRYSVSHEEHLGLLDEKTFSDSDSESGRSDTEFRLRPPHWTNTAKDHFSCVRSVPWSSWRVVIGRACIFFLPSFVHHRVTRQQARTEKLSPTSYLDGMRGLAALFVFFCHYSYQAFSIAQGYGAGNDNYNLLKLPFIRLFYQGPPAVCMFFVISGYALSYKPLKLMRSGKYDDFTVAMSSMTFRRIIRLYLPTFVSTLMIVMLLRLGVYDWTRSFANDKTFLKNVAEPHPERLGTLYEQLVHWAWNMFRFIHVFGWERYGGSTGYDVHLWTIPVEFRCSMYLFVTLVAVARLRPGVRYLTMFLIMAFTYRNQRWELLLFYCGTIIAELDLKRGAHVPQLVLPLTEAKPCKGRLRSLFWAICSIAALYLMSQPDVRSEETPGWVWLTSVIPKWWTDDKYRYWQSVGAVLFVLSVSRLSTWQRVFNAAVVQYLGKISYSMYLVHGPILHTLGYMIERRAYSITGVDGHWYNAGFVLASFGIIPMVIWAADIFWRLFDIPTVNFARWFESKCIVRK